MTASNTHKAEKSKKHRKGPKIMPIPLTKLPSFKQKILGSHEEGENEGEAHAVTAIPIQPSFPPTQQQLHISQ